MKHVLVVDDEKTQLMMLAMIVLEFGTGVSLSCSFTHEDAVKHMENNNVDILITDFNLFGEKCETGLTLMELAKQKNKNTKTVLISAMNPKLIPMDNCDLFLEKPITKINFIEKIKNFIN